MTQWTRNALLVLGCAAGAITMAMGCKKDAQIALPAGFTGSVNITCDDVGASSELISIDATGNAESHTCPTRGSNILLTRDGKPVTADGPIEWQTTGDGIVVGIRFNVR